MVPRSAGVYGFGPFRLDAARRLLSRHGVPIVLTARLFDLLWVLVEQRGRAIARSELMQRLWPGISVEENNISVNVSALRKALGESASEQRFIETLPRVGYRFVADVEEIDATSDSELLPASEAEASPGARSFVGREAELERLDLLLGRAREGRGRVVLLTGDAGIGKTALAEHFLARAVGSARRVLVARGRCAEQYGTGEAYLPFLDALSGLFASAAAASVRAVLQQRAPSWCGAFPAVFGADTAPPRPERGSVTRGRMLHEMADALTALAQSDPVILLLDDLHWADPSSLDLLSVMSQRELGRLLVLGTLRSERSRAPLENLRREMLAHELCDELALGGLTQAQIERLIVVRFGAGDSWRELGRSLFDKTEGHALFVARLLQLLEERGDIVRREGGWELARSVSEIDLRVPDSVRGVILRKLEQLSRDDRQALSYASVEGTEFSSTVLASTLGANEIEIEERLQAIEREQGLVRAIAEDELAGGGLSTRYRFAHGLYQNVLYEELVSKRRIQLHRRVADALLAQRGERASSIAAPLALHFERARDFSRAVQHLLEAGENAARLYASEEAQAHFSRALSLLRQLPGAEQAQYGARLSEKRAWLRFHRGEFALALADFDCMRASARASGNVELEGAAVYGSCRTLLNAHRMDEMEVQAREALRLAESAGSDKLRAEALVLTAQKQIAEGDLASASTVLNEALDTARRVRHEPVLLAALVWSGLLQFFQSRYATAAGSCTEAAALGHALGSADQALLGLYFVALSRANLGEINQALLVLDEAERLALHYSDRQALSRIPNARGWIYRELGDLDRAIEQDEKGRLLARQNALLEVETHSALNLAADHVARRADALALQAFDEAEALMARSEFARWRYTLRLLQIRGDHLLASGQIAAAERCARELTELATQRQAAKYSALGHLLLAAIEIERSDPATARERLVRALQHSERQPAALVTWKLRALLGAACLQSGDVEAARRSFGIAVDWIERIAGGVTDARLRAAFSSSSGVERVRRGLASSAGR